MKNTIIIKIDSDSDTPISVGKQFNSQPIDLDDTKEMINIDIKCITEALGYMIETSSNMGYFDKKQLMDETIIHLHSMLTEEKSQE